MTETNTGLETHTGDANTQMPPDLDPTEGREARHERQIERWIIIYLVGGLLVFTSTVLRLLNIVPEDISQLPAILGAIILGSGLFISAWRELRSGQPTSSTLAALAVLASFAIGRS